MTTLRRHVPQGVLIQAVVRPSVQGALRHVRRRVSTNESRVACAVGPIPDALATSVARGAVGVVARSSPPLARTKALLSGVPTFCRGLDQARVHRTVAKPFPPERIRAMGLAVSGAIDGTFARHGLCANLAVIGDVLAMIRRTASVIPSPAGQRLQ